MSSDPISLVINNSPYILKGRLGSGSYGVVYKAENQKNKQIVAIKAQDNVEESELKIIEKFKNQKFTNIVNIYDYQYTNNKHFVVMDYCDASLYQQIQKNKIEPRNLRYVIQQIANGIKEMHNQGLAHRDLKPENILIQTQSSEGRQQEFYKICDFGTSKEIQRLQTKQVGTPYYLAPEQLGQNFSNYTQSVDIWAFGAVIYELLTNEPLFNGYTIDQVTKKIRELDISKIIDTLKNIDNEYKELLKQMLQRDPKKRISIQDIINKMSQRRASVAKRTNNKIEKQEIKQLQLQPTQYINQNSQQQPQVQFGQQKLIQNQMPNSFHQNGPIKAFQFNQNNQNNEQILIDKPNQQQIKQVQQPNPFGFNHNPMQFENRQNQQPQKFQQNQGNPQQFQINQVNPQPSFLNQANPKLFQGNQNNQVPFHKPVQSDNFSRGNKFNQQPNQFPIRQFCSQDRKI